MPSSRGWPRRYPLFQPPNAPVLVAQALRLVAARAHGRTRTYAHVGADAAFAVWAWQELAHGVNGVRRGFGAIGLFLVAKRVRRRG